MMRLKRLDYSRAPWRFVLADGRELVRKGLDGHWRPYGFDTKAEAIAELERLAFEKLFPDSPGVGDE